MEENNNDSKSSDVIFNSSSMIPPEIPEDVNSKMETRNKPCCNSCSAERKFVFAIGSIDARFSSLSLEQEYNQVISIENTNGQTDNQLLHRTLKGNRYIAREMCWIYSIEGIDSYILVPKDPLDIDILVESLNQKTEGEDTSVLIGEMGPIATADMCNGLSLPIVFFDKIYTFSQEQLIDAIPKNDVKDKEFNVSATELFNRIKQISDNIGLSDEHRALNYLSVRSPQIYALVHKMHADGHSLSKIYVIPSRLFGTNKLLDVVFEFTDRKTGVRQQYYIRVDVTSKYPFVQNPLTQFFERT